MPPRRSRCAGSKKRSCKSKSACTWKKSKGCRRRKSYKSSKRRRSPCPRRRRRRSCSPCYDPCKKPCYTKCPKPCPDVDPCVTKSEELGIRAAYALLEGLRATEPAKVEGGSCGRYYY